MFVLVMHWLAHYLFLSICHFFSLLHSSFIDNMYTLGSMSASVFECMCIYAKTWAIKIYAIYLFYSFDLFSLIQFFTLFCSVVVDCYRFWLYFSLTIFHIFLFTESKIVHVVQIDGTYTSTPDWKMSARFVHRITHEVGECSSSSSSSSSNH